MKTGFITDEHYEEVRAYQQSATFDYDTLKRKYSNPFSDYPSEEITATTDVIIAGGGPSGLLYGLYLAQKGYDIVIIEPQEIGYTSREWNISLKEFLQLQCIVSEEELMTCICGTIVNDGNITFLDYFTYKCNDVLNRIVDPESFLNLLKQKILSFHKKTEEDIFYRTYYENFKIKDDRICVITRDGRKIEGKLFLHGMGAQDEIWYYSNYAMKKYFYTVVGMRGNIGKNIRPCGDMLRTLENATYGSNNQQIVWEHFMSEDPPSDNATIYAFYMANKRGNLVDLLRYFDQNLHSYIQTDVIEVHKVLFGYINLPDNITGLVRSCFPRVYVIGEGNINSVATGCGFALCIKNLERIGSQLVKALKHDNGSLTSMRSEKLNALLPDLRQLCSISIEQLFKEVLIRNSHETIEKPNIHCSAMFRLLSLIGDIQGRNDMLKSIMRPYLFLDALIKVRRETEYTLSDFFNILRSNNGDLDQRLEYIVTNYTRLIFCELKELLKHVLLFITCRKGHLKKSFRHIKTIWKANPIQFYLVQRYLKKRAIEDKI